MITKWSLKNFKSIREAELELAPLTIITGVNSSGKSSLLQSMAMLAQSAKNKDKTKRITLRGENERNENILIDLGEFKNIYCDNPCKTSKYADEDSKNNIVIAFSISSKEYEYIHYEYLFNNYGYFLSNSEAKALHMECKEKDKDIAFMNLNSSGVYETISPLEKSNTFDPVSENEIKKYHHKNVELDNFTFHIDKSDWIFE